MTKNNNYTIFYSFYSCSVFRPVRRVPVPVLPHHHAGGDPHPPLPHRHPAQLHQHPPHRRAALQVSSSQRTYSLFRPFLSPLGATIIRIKSNSVPRSHVSCHVTDHDRKTLIMRMFSPGAPLTGEMASPASTEQGAPRPRARNQALKVST